MALSIPLLFVPPVVAGCGYAIWYSGRELVLHRGPNQTDDDPSYPISSYCAGFAALGGTYYVQKPIIDRLSGKASAAAKLSSSQQFAKIEEKYTPPHKSANAYQPPQTMNELYQRLGRPAFARIAAGSVACFGAGVVQAYVTNIAWNDHNGKA